MVVHAEIDDDVGQVRVTRVLFHDEEGCGLLASPISARRLRRGETLDQTLGQLEMPIPLECRRERIDGLP